MACLYVVFFREKTKTYRIKQRASSEKCMELVAIEYKFKQRTRY